MESHEGQYYIHREKKINNIYIVIDRVLKKTPCSYSVVGVNVSHNFVAVHLECGVVAM